MSLNKKMLPIDYLYQGFALQAEAIAAEDELESIDYKTLQQRTEALAFALQQQLDEGSRVALCAQNHIDHLVSFCAILIAGFTWVPINPKNGAQLNQTLLEKSQPQLILVDQASEATLGSNRSRRVYLRQNSGDCINTLIKQNLGQTFKPKAVAAEAIMGLKFTGGTSGDPKGVMQSHANVAAVIENMQAMFEFNASDCNLAAAPLTHGGSHYILPVLAVGGRHQLLTLPEPDKILAAFSQGGASVSFMPPTLIYKLIDNPAASPDKFNSLRHLSYSAAPMPADKIQQAIDLFGPKLSTLYGQTEAPMTITAMSCSDMLKPELQASVGRACSNSKVAIFDQQQQTVAAGTVGEVVIKGDIVMSGYYNAAEKTEEVMNNGWLRTGDLGYLNDEGYLFLQGRSTEMMISGGFNIYPAEVENAVMSLAEQFFIQECCVFSQADDYWGERVEIAITMSGKNSLDSEKLSQVLKSLIGPVKTPKAYHCIEQLPRNPVGKVVRREVKALVVNSIAKEIS